MRLEELSDSLYIKGTDTVERYLLNLVQEYFKNSNIAATTSREYVIKKAVERMKEEITFDTIGVLSITLPDGEKRTGAVTISLEDLNGEPLISPKLSAFNVSFGTEQNTACEGNDPRLYDARTPLPHEHAITDITGLEGILSTIIGKIERVNQFLHEHSNESVLNMLVYTGDNTKIDLAELETLEDKVTKLVTDIRKEIATYQTQTDAKITAINNKIITVKDDINTIKQYILDTNKMYYDQAKQYVDDALKTANDEINDKLKELVTRTDIQEVLDVANNVYTLVGTEQLALSSLFDFTKQENQNTEILIPSSILDELAARTQTLADCQIEYLIQYMDLETQTVVTGALPFVVFKDNIVDGSIQMGAIYAENKLFAALNSASFEIPQHVLDADVIYKIYSKRSIDL